MKCNLCHMPFRKGDTAYLFLREDGTPEHYHPSCFAETEQGRMGYPAKEVINVGENHESNR